jgi:hypothetical protein
MKVINSLGRMTEVAPDKYGLTFKASLIIDNFLLNKYVFKCI